MCRYELHPSIDATLDSSVLLSMQSSWSAKPLDNTSVLEFDGISDFLAVKLMDDKQGRWDIAERVGGQLLLAAWVKTPDPSRCLPQQILRENCVECCSTVLTYRSTLPGGI